MIALRESIAVLKDNIAVFGQTCWDRKKRLRLKSRLMEMALLMPGLGYKPLGATVISNKILHRVVIVVLKLV